MFPFGFSFSFCFVCVLFETGFHCIALLAWNSHRSSCLWFFYVEIKGICFAGSQFCHVYFTWLSPCGLCFVSQSIADAAGRPLLQLLLLSPLLRAPRCCAFDFYFKILRLYVFFVCACGGLSDWVHVCVPHAGRSLQRCQIPWVFVSLHVVLEITPGSSL